MQSFRRLALSTLLAVYILILVGGIVRSTGSGMGCPDWPKCFGSWVPPTSVNELPTDYKDIYAEYRAKKNVRFAKYLSALGMNDTASKILNDPSVLEESDFNVWKTWIEYLNRVIGVVIGLLIFAVFVFSWKLRKQAPAITLVAFLTFLLVGFQGWIGSFVVSTNLTPWTVTVHMLIAMVIVAMLVWLVHRSRVSHSFTISSTKGFWLVMACMIALLVQIVFGTQVREAIDRVAASLPRDLWVDNLGAAFILHRSFSWLVLLLHVLLVVILYKTEGLKTFVRGLIVLILATILSGVGMAYWAVPAFLQPVHLLLATVTVGTQFMLLLQLNRKQIPVLDN